VAAAAGLNIHGVERDKSEETRSHNPTTGKSTKPAAGHLASSRLLNAKKAKFRKWPGLVGFLFESAPVELAGFLAAQEVGILVFLHFAEGEVPFAVAALNGGVFELTLRYPAAQVEVIGAAKATGPHVGKAQALVLSYYFVKVFALHREVKLAAPNALGGHHLNHERSVFYYGLKVRKRLRIANIISHKKQFLLANST
jgi:hypothetical protein